MSNAWNVGINFVNNELPNYFRNMFTYNHELHDFETRNRDRLHLYQTRTSGARNVLRHHTPELLNRFPQHLIDKMKTHSMYSVAHGFGSLAYSKDTAVVVPAVAAVGRKSKVK